MPPHLPQIVADSIYPKRIVAELLNNARQYTAAAEIAIPSALGLMTAPKSDLVFSSIGLPAPTVGSEARLD